MAWGYGTTTKDASAYEGNGGYEQAAQDWGDPSIMSRNPYASIVSSGPISRYSGRPQWENSTQRKYREMQEILERQDIKALEQLLKGGGLSPKTPWGHFTFNPKQKQFGFQFIPQPIRVHPRFRPRVMSPFIQIGRSGGMIGVRGDF